MKFIAIIAVVILPLIPMALHAQGHAGHSAPQATEKPKAAAPQTKVPSQEQQEQVTQLTELEAAENQLTKFSPSPSHGSGSSSNARTTSSTTATTFISDTTTDLNVKDTYQFKITGANGQVPTLVVGTADVFNIQLVKVSDNDYYFKLIATGKPGTKAGIYVNGVKLLTATVTATASTVKSDTSLPFNIKTGATYTFKITAESKPTLVAGTPSGFSIDYVKAVGKDYFFKVTAIGKAGTVCGFYINSQTMPVAVATITK